MALREIRKEGDEILRKKSRAVEVVDDRIRQLIKDMDETMHSANGVGISAVQVGILKRVIVIDINYDGTPSLKLINPEVVKTRGSQEFQEGCLSFPNKYAKVIRPNEVIIKALDENGKKVTIKGKGILAEALLHEIDHLDGKLFIDVMEPGTLEYIENNERQK